MNGPTYYAQWFVALFRSRRMHDLGAEYRALAERPLLLADIMARAGVFDPAPKPDNPQNLAWHEGRRSLALEMLHLARAEPLEIETYLKTAIRTQPPKEPRHG